MPISILILLYFGISSFYMLLFALFGKLIRIKAIFIPEPNSEVSVAILIPAYKEDLVIIDTVLEIKELEYLNYEIIVISDSLQPNTIKKLNDLNINIIDVVFKESTKLKALNHALANINGFDTALILDADNHLKADFLKIMNKHYQAGNDKVYQGQRIAKNYDTPISILDALSERINNNIYSQGPINVKLSTRLVGSGMFFEFNLLKDILSQCTAIGGDDKELELKLLERRIFLQYLPNCIIYDEKVSSNSNFKKQRTRWIAAQFQYFRAYFIKSCKELVSNGNIDLFNKIIQLGLPPRLLIPAVLFTGSLTHLFIYPQLFKYWFSCLIANVVANLISVPRSMYNKNLLLATIKLPGLIIMTLVCLLGMSEANKRFLHTTHGEASDSE